jgi:exodeoxyribonuclease VII large subunit
MQSISVSTLNDQIKSLLETTFLQVAVEGEVSRPTYHGSGHVYFSIKDANAQVKAVMFRGNASRLKFRLEDGMKVVLFGAVTLYKPRGEYQINVSHVEVAGEGNLALAFKQLKEKLSAAGFFNPEVKKPQPPAIHHIAIITSATGAALQDMLRLVSKRWPMVKITLIDVVVQGEQASAKITNAIHYADTLGVDAIVISRGGGSIEDLWAFNEENVATALFHAQTFTVSAVGHEIDWVISDYVADMRAATPTAAMELLLPDQWEMQQYMDGLRDQLNRRMMQIVQSAQQNISALKERFSNYSIENKFESYRKDIASMQLRMGQFLEQKLHKEQLKVEDYQQQLDRSIRMNLAKKEQAIQVLEQGFKQANPANRDAKGMVELSSDGKKIPIEKVAVGHEVQIANSKVLLDVTVTKKREL